MGDHDYEDWLTPQYGIADRCAWYVLRNGQVVIGPKGVVHDDVLADGMLEEDEIAGRGEYWPDGGRIEQLRPLGTEFATEVEHALDQGSARHLGSSKRPTPFNVTSEGLVTFLKPGEIGQGLIVPVGKLYRIEGIDTALHHHVHRAWTQTLDPPDLHKKQAGPSGDDWNTNQSEPTWHAEVPGAAPGLKPTLQGADVPAQSLPGTLCGHCNAALDGEMVCPHCATKAPLPPPELVRSSRSRRSSAELRSPAPAPGSPRGPGLSGRDRVHSSRRRFPSVPSLAEFDDDVADRHVVAVRLLDDEDAMQVPHVALLADEGQPLQLREGSGGHVGGDHSNPPGDLQLAWVKAANQMQSVVARRDKKLVGVLTIARSDMYPLEQNRNQEWVVYNVQVPEEYQRQGIASAMLSFARERYSVGHSSMRTSEGEAWSAKVGSSATVRGDGNDTTEDWQAERGPGAEVQLRGLRPQAARHAAHQAAQELLAAAQIGQYLWPDLDEAKALSEGVVDNHQGYRDERLLQSGIQSAQNQHTYGGVNDPYLLAAHIVNGVQRNQPLVEGNKRTGTGLGLAFLAHNGYPNAEALLGPEHEREMHARVLGMAEGTHSPEDLADYMRSALWTPQSPEGATEQGEREREAHREQGEGRIGASVHEAENSTQTYWVYLNGQVGFDKYPWRAARNLAMQVCPEKADYIGNTIARNDIPKGIDCAVGQLLGNRPQIWLSTVDRNHVWDAVVRALNSPEANRPTPAIPNENAGDETQESGTPTTSPTPGYGPAPHPRAQGTTPYSSHKSFAERFATRNLRVALPRAYVAQSEQPYGDLSRHDDEQRVEQAARFAPGEHVRFYDGTGVIVGEPVDSYEGKAYYVDTYDQQGPRGVELWAESLLQRPREYDQSGQLTLKDFGIPPEGESYYRSAGMSDFGIRPRPGNYGDYLENFRSMELGKLLEIKQGLLLPGGGYGRSRPFSNYWAALNRAINEKQPQRLGMGLRGDLPEGMQFIVRAATEEDHDNLPSDDYTNPTDVALIAEAYLGREVIGTLTVQHDGTIAGVEVAPAYRRMGVASALLEFMRKSGYDVEHSENLTTDGEAWAEHTE